MREREPLILEIPESEPWDVKDGVARRKIGALLRSQRIADRERVSRLIRHSVIFPFIFFLLSRRADRIGSDRYDERHRSNPRGVESLAPHIDFDQVFRFALWFGFGSLTLLK